MPNRDWPPADVTAKEYVPPPPKRATLFFSDAYGAPKRVDVEVVDTEPMRRRGLMWREKLEEGDQPRLIQTIRGVGYSLRQASE